MSTYTAAAGGGNWSNSSTWGGGGFPVAGDTAILGATSGNVTVDAYVTPAVKASGYMELDTATPPYISHGNILFVADTIYTFVSSIMGGPDEVLIGANDNESLNNLKAAINYEAGFGVKYTSEAQNSYVECTSVAGVKISFLARDAGSSGNSINLSTDVPDCTVNDSGSPMDWFLSGGNDELTGAYCAVINCTGYTGTLTLNSSITTTSDITFSDGMTFTPNTNTWYAVGNLDFANKTLYALNATYVTLVNNDVTLSGGLYCSVAILGTGRTVTVTGGTVVSTGVSDVNITFSGNITSINIYVRSGTIKYSSGTISSAVAQIQGGILDTNGMVWNTLIFGAISQIASFTLASQLDCSGTAYFYNATTISGNYLITCGGISFLNNNATHTLSGNIDCNGSLGTSVTTIINGVGKSINVSGGLTINQNISGTANIVMDGTGTWNCGTSKYVEINLEINTLGTITVGANACYKTGILKVSSGTFSSTAIQIIGSCSLDNAVGARWNKLTITASGTYTLLNNISTSGLLTISTSASATFVGAYDITCVGFTCNGGVTHTLSGNIDCNGAMTVQNGTVRINGSHSVYVSGNLSLSASPLLGTATIVLDGTGTWNGTNTSAIVNSNLTINTTGIITLSSAYYKSGTLTYVSGTVHSGGHLYLYGSCTLATAGVTWYDMHIKVLGTYTMTEGFNSKYITLSAPTTFAGSHTITCEAMSIQHAGPHNISHNIYCTSRLTAMTTSTTINGPFKLYLASLSVVKTLTGSSTICFYTDGTWAHAPNQWVAMNIEINTPGTLTISGTIYYSSGTLTYISGTVDASDGSLSLGPGNAIIDTDGITWYNVSAESGSHTLASSLEISDRLILRSGAVIDLGSHSVSIGGNLTNEAGSTGLSGTGTVIFNGNTTISASTSFYNLHINPGKTLTLTAGTTQTITNVFSAIGTSSGRITINSTGAVAYLSKASGLSVCNYIDVNKVSATGGAKWYAGTNSTVVNSSGWLLDDWDTIYISPTPGTFGVYEWIAMSSFEPTLEIRYTLDNTDPTYLSASYTGPFKIIGTIIKARGYLYGGSVAGYVYTFNYYSTPLTEPSGFLYNEYYLYSDKAWDIVPSGVTDYDLASSPLQNAPIVVTPSGYERTTPTDPWALVSGGGKWRKVGFGGFTTTASGTIDTRYDEFSLHPNASGTLIFNKPTPRTMFVEYEAGVSGSYILDTVDFNPIRNEAQSGFVQWVSNTSVPTYLYITASPSSIWADGYQIVRLTATMMDENFSRLPNKPIVFEAQGLIPGYTPVSGAYYGHWSSLGWLQYTAGSTLAVDASGAPIKVSATTNTNGEAKAIWHPYANANGVQSIKAYYADASGLADTANIYQTFFISGPFTLDISLLSMADYLI